MTKVNDIQDFRETCAMTEAQLRKSLRESIAMRSSVIPHARETENLSQVTHASASNENRSPVAPSSGKRGRIEVDCDNVENEMYAHEMLL